MSDMTPILVKTCCLDRPSLGTPSANVSALSAPGSQRWRMNNDTYARKFFSDFPLRSRVNLIGVEMIKEIAHQFQLQKKAMENINPYSADHFGFP